MYEFTIKNFVNFTLTVSGIPPLDNEMTQRNFALKKELTSTKDTIKDQHLIPLLEKIDLVNKKLKDLNRQKEIVNQEKKNLERLDKSIEDEQNESK